MTVKTPKLTVVFAASLALLLAGCGSKNVSEGEHSPGRRGPGGGRTTEEVRTAAVPVQVEQVTRRSIAEYLHANGTLEAENEVDLVARTAGPITALLVEEGNTVRAGQTLARIDDREARNQAAIATVRRDEARLAFERARTTHEKGLVSQEDYDVALSGLQSAEAQLETATIQLAYTEIRAPFDALVVARYIKLAEFVSSGMALFRISDFIPLLCPIEVPEKDLSRLHVGQAADIRVEAYPGETFKARVQRIRPTVGTDTGTVTVTLEVEGRGILRPGMFASVYLQTNTHENVLVIPRSALVLDSIGDTVFVLAGDTAERREVRLGIREEDHVEVVDGLSEGEAIVILGQEGLGDGTPVTVLGEESAVAPLETSAGSDSDRLEAMRQRMRDRGIPEEEIESRERQRTQAGDSIRPQGSGDGAIPPFMEQRIREASPEELVRIKERMRSFGMSDERVEEIVARIRNTDS